MLPPTTPRQRRASGLRVDVNGLQNDMLVASPGSNPTSPGYGGLSSPTFSGSWNTNKSHAELTAMLKEAYGMIKEKERDLTLAAEIGKSLLENNLQLKAKYEALVVQLQHVQRTRSRNPQSMERGAPRLPPPNSSLGGLESFPEESSDYEDSDNESNASGIEMPPSRSARGGISHRDLERIQELEMKNAELASRLDTMLSESQENEKSYKAKIRRLESDSARSQEEYAAAIEKIETLEQDNQRLIRKQSEDFWNLKYSRNTDENDNEDIIDRLQQKVDALDKTNHTLERSKAEIEKKLQKTVREMETLRAQYNEVSQASKEFKELQVKYEEQSEHIAELAMSLEEQRDINISMRSGIRSSMHSRAGSFSEHALRRLSDPDAMNALRGITSTAGNKNPRRSLMEEFESEFQRAIFQRGDRRKNSSPPFSPVMSESDLSEYARSVGMSEAEEDILSAVDYMSEDEFTFLDEFKEDDEKAMRRREWFFRRWARAVIRFLRSIWRWCRFLVLLCAAVVMALYRGPDYVLPGEM